MAKRQSWFTVNARGNEASVSILGDIGGWGVSFADFRRSVEAAGSIRRLNISINSDGGDVYTGFAIYNFLARHSARKIVTVEGLAASMASVVFMVGDERIMPANAQLMIHNPMGSITGEGDQIVKFGESVNKMRMNIANAYADRTLLPVPKVLKMMDAQTWIGADEALDMGFATKVEEPRKIAAYFDLSKFKNAPKSYGQNGKGTAMPKTRQNAGAADDEFEEKDVDTIRKEERDRLRAQHREVTALCKIAGRPELAAKFIDDDKTPADVTAELERLADEDAKKGGRSATRNGKGGASRESEVSARHRVGEEGGDAPKEINTLAIYANWNKRKALGL